ncbi:MAG: PD-(D/E)XK nuclease family transposase [Acidobacteriota bacterium]|nr:PD-(D/E)XK nuclease family transposase [Acidobacteriota bacterium]
MLQGRFPTRKKTRHLRFRLWDTTAKQLLTDHLDIHVLQLQSRAVKPKIVDDEARWLYFLRFGHRLDDENLPEWLDTPFIRRAMDVIREIRDSEETYEQYEARLKGERWYSTLVSINKRLQREKRQERMEARRQMEQLTRRLEETEHKLQKVSALLEKHGISSDQ